MPPVPALHRIDLTSLPTGVRRALVGIDDLLLHHVDLVTRFRRVTTRDGLPAYWDDNHLSRRGARELAPELAEVLR